MALCGGVVTEALSLTKRSLPRRSMGHSDITKMEARDLVVMVEHSPSLAGSDYPLELWNSKFVLYWAQDA